MSFARILVDESGQTYMEEVDLPEDRPVTAEDKADQVLEAKARSRAMYSALNANPPNMEDAPHPKGRGAINKESENNG
jgi:hypothetical protein